MSKYAAGSFLGVIFVMAFLAILMLLSTLELQSAALESQTSQKVPTTLGSIKNSMATLVQLRDQETQRMAKLGEQKQNVVAWRHLGDIVPA